MTSDRFQRESTQSTWRSTSVALAAAGWSAAWATRASIGSIGKLATGQADYYLEQAHGRIDRVTSVAAGVEDYCFESSEPDGVWIGSGSGPLGASGR